MCLDPLQFLPSGIRFLPLSNQGRMSSASRFLLCQCECETLLKDQVPCLRETSHGFPGISKQLLYCLSLPRTHSRYHQSIPALFPFLQGKNLLTLGLQQSISKEAPGSSSEEANRFWKLHLQSHSDPESCLQEGDGLTRFQGLILD